MLGGARGDTPSCLPSVPPWGKRGKSCWCFSWIPPTLVCPAPAALLTPHTLGGHWATLGGGLGGSTQFPPPAGERNSALAWLLWRQMLSWGMCPPQRQRAGVMGGSEVPGRRCSSITLPRGCNPHCTHGVTGAVPPDPTQRWGAVGEQGSPASISWSCLKKINKIK